MDAIEDVLEQVGRFAVGTVNGIKLTVSVRRVRDVRYAGLFLSGKTSEPYWKLVVDAPDFYVFVDGSIRRFDDKATAMAEFKALVAKYGLTEER